MKKLIFLLIPLLLTNLVNSCAPNDSEIVKQKTLQQSEIVKQKTLRQIEQAKERAEQKLTPQKRMEYAKEHRARQVELSKYAKEHRARQAELSKIEQELYDKEQEAKYKRFKEEWVEFIQSGEGSLRNKTTQEVKKLVDQWKYHQWGLAWESAKEDLSSENFYKIFGKPWKTQYIDIENKYLLWFTCKEGTVLITVGAYEYDDGWVNILDLNIL